jgi:hypothetical protein
LKSLSNSDSRTPQASGKVLTIVSGGQTGVDRGALDAALAAGAPCGGWCPAGRLAEDGRVPDKYPLRELKSGGYPERTLANVRDSDGTLVIYAGKLEGGTEHTALLCVKLGKPHQLIDGNDVDIDGAVELTKSFIARHPIETLNVAGPRASKQPQLYAYAYAVIAKLLQRVGAAA